ncbi:MAG: hypothetical protein ACI8QW_001737, partial [Saprospiraceae bacterium]
MTYSDFKDITGIRQKSDPCFNTKPKKRILESCVHVDGMLNP